MIYYILFCMGHNNHKVYKIIIYLFPVCILLGAIYVNFAGKQWLYNRRLGLNNMPIMQLLAKRLWLMMFFMIGMNSYYKKIIIIPTFAILGLVYSYFSTVVTIQYDIKYFIIIFLSFISYMLVYMADIIWLYTHNENKKDRVIYFALFLFGFAVELLSRRILIAFLG